MVQMPFFSMWCMARLDYRNKVILAPMVRIGTLPTRLLALQYGADIVYCEEIIDHKILSAKRIDNTLLGTVDYVLSDTTVVFRTHPSEKDRLVFQLGTADACTALKAAKKIEGDVAAIDVNMGCPKEFSIKGGMGAALLKKPEKIKEILTTLVQNVSVPITCKIRLLPELEDNISLVKMIEGTGVSAIGIHGRLTGERQRHPNRNGTIRILAQRLTIPVIANGGSKEILCYDDIEKFRLSCNASSVMIARAAEWNTSIFRKEGKLPIKDVVRDYLNIAIDTDNGFSNTKYCMLMMMHADMDQMEGLYTQDAKCLEEICVIWGMTYEYTKKVRWERKKKREEVDKYYGIKKKKTDDGKCLITMPIKFIKKDYPVSISPKLKLYEWTKRSRTDKPCYITSERTEDRCYKSVMEVEGTKYTSTFWEKSKQLTEQAAAIVCLIVIGEDDGRKPDSESPNDEVIQVWREEFHVPHDAIHKHKSENSGKSPGEIAESGDSKYRNSVEDIDIYKHNEESGNDTVGIPECDESKYRNSVEGVDSDVICEKKSENSGKYTGDIPVSGEPKYRNITEDVDYVPSNKS